MYIYIYIVHKHACVGGCGYIDYIYILYSFAVVIFPSKMLFVGRQYKRNG